MMPLTEQDLMALLDLRIAQHQAKAMGNRDPRLPVPLDWHALFKRENTTEWLVDDLWPVGRQIHIHAARKTGKSLVALWISCNLAIGRDPFSGSKQAPVRVAYLDYEMSEDDLLERVEEMGFAPDALTGWLPYYLHPVLPKLDTPEGGGMLHEMLVADQAQAVVIDTFSRVVQGEENSNDTYIKFYNNTGQRLKSSGIAMLRLDHEGHEGGRSRGASAKADDVDIVWQLQVVEGGMMFVRKAARVSWVPETITLQQDEPLSYKRAGGASYPAGTLDKAKELDDIKAPIDVSKRKAAELLKNAGMAPGKWTILLAAIAYRRNSVFGI